MNNINYRHPETGDGPLIHQLVKDCAPLDLNSVYLYLLLASHFRGTCLVAETDGKRRMAGFVSAYYRPDEPDTLFVWQIAVHPDFRGRGIARGLLRELLAALYQKAPPVYLELSVNPSNKASRTLFESLAKNLETGISERELFPERLLGEGHEAEILLRIGPLPASPNNSNKE